MPLYEPYLPARYVSPLLDIVAAQRASFVNQILQQVGLTPTQLRASDALLTSSEFDARRLMNCCVPLPAIGDKLLPVLYLTISVIRIVAS